MSATKQDLLSIVEMQVNQSPHQRLYAFLNKEVSISHELTYAALYDKAVTIAAVLQQRRLQKSPIALLYPHGPDFIVAFLGTILAGAWPMPLTKPRGKDWTSVLRTIATSGATTVLTLSSTQRLIPQALLHAGRVQVLCTDVPDWPVDVASWQRPDVQPHDIAFIQYTSGSTSHPRGVIVTHANVLHNSESIRQRFGCSPEHVCVSWLPFHHDMGLIGHVIQSLYCGVPNYFLSPADFIGDPLRWLRAISRCKATISGAPTFAYALCAENGEPFRQDEEPLDLSTWRLAYCGSERIVPSVLARFARRFASASFDKEAFFPCYGMAESTLFVCGQYGVTPSSQTDYPGVGRIMDQDSIVIVDPLKQRPLPDGTTGEVWLRSSSLSPGYFNDAAATRTTFDQVLDGVPGYMRTGDLGFIRQGTLHFVGRLKNVFKRRGRTFHAEDIEERVERVLNTQGITRCAAFTVPNDESDALILLLEHASTVSGAMMATIPTAASTLVCNEFGIAPDDVQIVPKRALPLTTSGKLQRERCRERYLESSVKFSVRTQAQGVVA